VTTHSIPPLPSEEGTAQDVLRAFNRTPGPASGRYCLTCAILAGQWVTASEPWAHKLTDSGIWAHNLTDRAGRCSGRRCTSTSGAKKPRPESGLDCLRCALTVFHVPRLSCMCHIRSTAVASQPALSRVAPARLLSRLRARRARNLLSRTSRCSPLPHSGEGAATYAGGWPD